MRVPGSSLAVVLSIACLSLGSPTSVHAALGGSAASVQADTDAVGGTLRATSLPAYEIREISTDSTTRIREFLRHDGRVFAVSWTGPVMPDLKALLGEHFAAYTAALAAVNAKGLHRFVRVSTANLVVESGGHMRAFSGRAYLPASLPPDVTAADIH